MNRRLALRRLAGATALLGLAPRLTAQAQDTRTRMLDLGGATTQVPESWKSIPPTSQMRKLQLSIPRAEGDSQDADFALFIFPSGTAGTVQANIDRWRNQFRDASGAAPRGEIKTVKGKNLEVTRVALAGTFTDPFAGKGAQPDYRLLGAIFDTSSGAFFIKLVGPAKTITAAEADFDRMIASLQLGVA